jgi:tetratricopeptide (TPR) repeat protein
MSASKWAVGWGLVGMSAACAPPAPGPARSSAAESPAEAFAGADAPAAHGLGVVDGQSTASADGAAEPLTLDYKKQRKLDAMRGLAYDSGRVQIAAGEASQIVSGRDPGAASIARLLAQDQMQSNLVYEAIASATRAVLLAPDVSEGYLVLGQALLLKRLVPEATAAFRSGVDLAPDSVGLHFALGDALARGDARRESTAHFERALELDPAHAAARERLAIQLYYLGEHARAWQHVHAAEASGRAVPPQFRAQLAQSFPEPTR